MKLINLFKRSNASNPDVEFAFACNGVDYYCFKDINKLPAIRGLMAYTVFNELEMRVDRNYLHEFKKALDASINGKFLKTDIAQLSVYLGERLNMVIEPDILIKLATVYFFDAKEDVNKYDFAYANEKRKRWEAGGVNDFFSKLPISKLINFTPPSEFDFPTYLEQARKLSETHARFLSELKSNG
jgi:hypothetical protein